LFTNAIGECDEPGLTIETPAPQPQRAPLECDGQSCLPQHAPLDASGGFAVSFTSPLAVLGTTIANPEPSTFLVTNDVGGPRAGFCLRIDRPPKRN
jgi:hypothetical protein